MKTPGNNGAGTPAAAATSTSAAATSAAPPSEGGTGSAASAEEKNVINPELWQACAGPLVNVPPAGTHVVYFPQGHSEQVAASMKKDIDAQVPNYPNLPSKLLCLVHNVTLHADPETDEVFAQMTLQPVPSFDKEALLRSDLALKSKKPQPEFFCKTLTASDTSTHGGFSVPRRAAEKIFPPLDFSMQPPAQELVARDLHDNVWNFRHIFRGQPKRHLLTTGWSLFVSGKRISAGDSVLFIRNVSRDDKQQLLLGTRRANRQPTNLPSSVLSSDSMHIGILAAAAHAAANNSPFTVFYNPRASPSEFIIPLAKYYKAVYSNQISSGMRFRMLFETEESGTQRYMGTITGISDIDPVRWKNSQWRNLQVGWDESTAGEKRSRVSIWEIETVTAPFFICPPPLFRSKRPRQPGFPDDDFLDLDGIFKSTMPWLDDDIGMKDSQALSGIGLMHWMNMPQNRSNSMQHCYLQSRPTSILQNLGAGDLSRQIVFSTQQNSQPNNLLFSAQRLAQQTQSLDQLKKSSVANPLSSAMPPLIRVSEVGQQTRQSAVAQTVPLSQAQAQILQQQTLVQSSAPVLQQQSLNQNQQVCGNSNLPQSLHQMQQQSNLVGQNEQLNSLTSQLLDPTNPQFQISDNRIQHQLLQKLQQQQQQQQQSLLAQQSYLQQSALISSQELMQHLDASQCFPKTVAPSEMTDMSQAKPSSSQSTSVQPQVLSSSQQFVQFSNQPQPMKPQLEEHILVNEIPGNMGFHPNNLTNQASNAAGSILSVVARGGQSVITDDVLPSCPVSSSRNNFQPMVGVQSMINSRTIQGMPLNEDKGIAAGTFLSPSTLEIVGSSASNLMKDFQKSETKPSLIIPKSQNQNHESFGAQAYVNSVAAQSDYLDSSSSTTSVCLSQNDVHLQQNNNSVSYNRHPTVYRDANQDGDVPADIKTGVAFGSSPDAQNGLTMDEDSLMAKGIMGLGKELSGELSSAALLTDFNQKDTQQISSSMVSQSFGVADVGFASMESPINESAFLNRGPWGAPPPQFQRMRTFTKVYKRGAVGRCIDITRYSGYNELKQDLARRFGIEGQLEDGQRIGWKLVYVDHENDMLLVGDDPWEEFVNCVRCIKILSPQEVQQMSLDGDFGSIVLPNHGCSSSDGGNI